MGETKFTNVESITLKEKLSQLTADKNKYALKELFKKLAVFIGEHQDAKRIHGNITDEHILINSYGGIYLNQSVSVENLIEPTTLSFNKNFAHPDHLDFQYSVFADDFSLLTIATSVFAYTIEPELFSSLQSEKVLLFSKRDFENFKTSRVFDYLQSLNSSLLNILLSQIKIALVNKSPKVENLASLMLLDEKYHTSIKTLKEKEFLQTYVDYKEEYIEVLQEKYVEQVKQNVSNNFILAIEKEAKNEVAHQYTNLKNSNKNFLRAFCISCILLLGFFLNNSISGKTTLSKNEFAATLSTSSKSIPATLETPVNKIVTETEKIKNKTELYTVKNNLAPTPTSAKPIATTVTPKKESNLKKQQPIEKITTPSAPSVTFKEINFTK